MRSTKSLALFFAFFGLMLAIEAARATDLSYVATQYDLGGTFFPGGGPANVQSYVVSTWRTDDEANFYSVSPDVNERYYGTAGYALFATRFDYPNADATTGNAFVDPNDNSVYPNIINLPSFVTGSQIFATRKAGGWAYALIDDPRITAGYRDYNWGDTQSPPSMPEHSQAPYVKLGVIDGRDTIANTDPTVAPAARWGFQVGANVPQSFRVGVMTDGLDGTAFVPGKVVLSQVNGTTVITSVSTDPLIANRFVDMSFFDVTGAKPGDQFLFSAQAAPGGLTAAIDGFSFDILEPFVPSGPDFNGDAHVDGADFIIWQQGLGNTGALQSEGDANGDGNVTAADLAIWKTQFGAPSVAASAAVPEPGCMPLVPLGIVAWWALKYEKRIR